MRGKYKRRKATQATEWGKYFGDDPVWTLDHPDIQNHLRHKSPHYIEHFKKGFVLARMGIPDPRERNKSDLFAAMYGGTATGRIASGKTQLNAQISVSKIFGLDKIAVDYAKAELEVLKKYGFIK